GVIGAGVMGAGIAQLALEAGHEVFLHDVDEAALDRGADRIRDGLTRRALKLVDGGGVDDWVEERMGGLRRTDVLEEVADAADVVVEAALESLDLKQTIFRTLDATAALTTILATNTSALSVAEIAAATNRPARVLGLHFFNPAPVMRLVEVVATDRTAPSVLRRATELVTSWGRTPVAVADRPGFVVNRVNRPFTIEALRTLETEIATVPEIDAALRDAGFPLGPFELMDLTGLDVTTAAATAIWERLGRPDRLRPSPIQRELVDAGRLGRKTGEGFYRYEAGRSVGVAERFSGPPTNVPPGSIRDRILDAVGLEARLAVEEGVARAADVDLALRLGAGHPIGPFERSGMTAGATGRTAANHESAGSP
ncbi:MAG TPA: 3-hydroxyacyl-CoA dehydrogenase NAD-binding domain-containing protein, partial [Candidatus Limnocylindrales bacterium]|nr:3-hydroxyacyl-CoA dehydrogenase NAD-binding domain-containing protein [Candidatus Limnocylindrales bacterium]